MTHRSKVWRTALMLLVWFDLVGPAHPVGFAASSESVVPAPSRAFTSRTALAFYADVQAAGRSAIWKTITNRAAPLVEQLQSAQQGRMTSLQTAEFLPSLKGAAVAEIAASFEGDKVLGDIESNQFDPNSSFIVVFRLTGTPDVNALIEQALQAIEKQKPGLREQIEKSRRKVGAAEFFDVPGDVLGEQKPPFKLSAAIGPGKEGTIAAFGRSENLEAFLSGNTEGKLKGGINETLSRRGQIWLHLPVPKDATKGLGGGPDAAANPMLAGLAQSMDKVREANLSLNLGSSQVDFELNLGCDDGAAASQLAQGIQGLIGMMQMGARQNPSSMPPFVGRIKAAAEGAVFRLTTAFTTRDLDMALKSAGIASQARTSVSIPVSKPEPEPAVAPPPVDVEFVGFNSEQQESLRPARMRVHNRSPKPVKELKLTFTYRDKAGRKLGEWTRDHSSLTTQNLVRGDATQVVDCLAFNVPAFTQKVDVTLLEVIFSDGEKWDAHP